MRRTRRATRSKASYFKRVHIARWSWKTRNDTGTPSRTSGRVTTFWVWVKTKRAIHRQLGVDSDESYALHISQNEINLPLTCASVSESVSGERMALLSIGFPTIRTSEYDLYFMPVPSAVVKCDHYFYT